ncbi:hypothetical protein ACWGCW_38135 [Streptomyces sp. NPDC054933]
MLRAMGQSGAAPSDGAAGTPNCSPAPLGRGEDLPEVVGNTSAVTQYLVGDRFRGSPEKLRDVAETWRKAKRITERVLSDAQDSWRTASSHSVGETADAVNTFFAKFVGPEHPQAKVDGNAHIARESTHRLRAARQGLRQLRRPHRDRPPPRTAADDEGHAD